MWKEVALSPKGQITLPKEMREELGLQPGDTMVYTIIDRQLVITPKSIDFNDLAGFLGDPPGGRATLEEIDSTVAENAGAEAVAHDRKIRGNAA